MPSPTFTLVQFYESDPPVAHFDLYRLTRPEEAFEIGLDEALDDGCALIEWPERLGEDPAALPGARPSDHHPRRTAARAGLRPFLAQGRGKTKLKDLHV